MSHRVPLIEVLESRVDFIQLPFLRFDVGSNGFSREKRFGATRALGQRLELLLGVAVNPALKGL